MLSRFSWAIVLFCFAFATPALAQNIDTRPNSNGGTVGSFRPGPSAAFSSFGQTFEVPVGQTGVQSFSIRTANVPASLTFRGYLMPWDPATTRAIGPVLYESNDVNTTGATAQDVTFTIPGSVPVTPGQTYVIFLSAVNSTGPEAGNLWRTTSDVIPNGRVSVQATASPADWTGQPWQQFPQTTDLAVTVNFTAAAAPVPTMSEWAMILLGTILAGGAALYIQRRRQFV